MHTVNDRKQIVPINKLEIQSQSKEDCALPDLFGCLDVSNNYISITADMQRSYSKKAYPWDNACIEAFHALIKREWLNRFKIFDYNHAYKLVFQYIETFYNTVRIHSHCDYLSPNEYEELYWRELKAMELTA